MNNEEFKTDIDINQPFQKKAVKNSPFVCRLCGSNHSIVKYTLDKCDFIQCKSCKLMVIDPIPSIGDIKSVYDEHYFSNPEMIRQDVQGIYGYSDYVGERINKQYAYKNICQKIQLYLKDKLNPVRLLDFGCGLGHFLDSAYDFGYLVHGVEFNEYAINYIRNRYTYKIISYEDFLKTDEKFDVVTLFDVIEHLQDPFETLNRLYNLINNKGLLIISTMDSHSFMSRLLGLRLEDFKRIREHIYFFSKKNLSDLLTKLGFEILEVRSQGHTFEMRHLCSRIKNSLPFVGNILAFILNIFPALGNLNIYINPHTKMIIYARKKGSDLFNPAPLLLRILFLT
ncbi:MAG: class I SAM-dependent methyltransferase [Candidatus Omnitrophota bacterium]